MQQVTIKSIYGKTLSFEDYHLSGNPLNSGAANVIYRDDDGNFKGGMIFRPEELNKLRVALGNQQPVEKADAGVFFLLRQKNSNPTKIRACFAPDGLSSGVHSPKNKEYHSRRKAELARDSLNARYGHEWTYFVVEKEAK
ncbi:hypothetical protein uav_083 [Pseudomonas phage UAVern]|uniref:Uncharacterized protein n=1 Tax=Pseudomonas phage UAVern TaxID=2856997 RepID=A0A975YYQ1_9CAUD|nr:hypothetical protein uav_083 [Pseudomonas phage UAVern]